MKAYQYYANYIESKNKLLGAISNKFTIFRAQKYFSKAIFRDRFEGKEPEQ
jgi:hypothetical protein